MSGDARGGEGKYIAPQGESAGELPYIHMVFGRYSPMSRI